MDFKTQNINNPRYLKAVEYLGSLTPIQRFGLKVKVNTNKKRLCYIQRDVFKYIMENMGDLR